MKIAILTSGILPVPAVQGGAVENLIDFYLEYNEKHKIHHFTVYSVYHPLLKNKKETSHTSYHHIKNDRSFFIRLKRFIFKKTHRNLYYDSSIEFFLYKALQDIKKKEIDAILLENRPGYALSIPKTIKAQLILHLHNDLLNEQTRSSIEMYNNISNIITVSEYIKKQVDGVNKALPSKSITVPNGIDLDKFNKDKYIGEDIRKDLGYTEDDFIIVYSGRIIAEKGVKELLEALLLLEEYSMIKLLIIGGSFFGNETQESSYMKDIQHLSVPIKERIKFTGFVPYEEVPKFLSIADIAIVPSLWEEPFALTCAEAMAMGVPLIISNSGGMSEVVDANCAIIFDKTGDIPKNIRDGILELYNDNSKREKMSKAALKRAQLFSKEVYAERITSLLSVKSI